MNNVAKLNKDTIKIINKFLKKENLEQFDSKQLKAMLAQDVLGICLLSAIIRGDILNIEIIKRSSDDDFDENACYGIALTTCLQSSDILVLDKNFYPINVVENVWLN